MVDDNNFLATKLKAMQRRRPNGDYSNTNLDLPKLRTALQNSNERLNNPFEESPFISENTKYNQQWHPQICSGEVWITNISPYEEYRTKFKTVRIVDEAYDCLGRRCAGRAVFVSRDEWERAGCKFI
jgi:hypothetical protein